MRKLFIAVSLGVATALLAACGATNGTTGLNATSRPVAAQEAASDPDNGPDVGHVGDTWPYESGVEVTLLSLKKAPIGQYAAGASTGEQGVLVKIRITNKSDSVFDSNLASVKLRYGKDGEEAEQVFDVAQKNSTGFEGNIRKGKSATASYFFAIPKSGKKTTVDIEFAGDWNSEPAQFTGKL